MRQPAAARHAACLRYMRDKANLLSIFADDARARVFLMQAIAIYTGQPQDDSAFTEAVQRLDHVTAAAQKAEHDGTT